MPKQVVDKRVKIYRNVFQKFDADGSGKISKAEVCQAMGIPIDDDIIKDL